MLSWWKDLAQTVQAAATCAAIGIGACWWWRSRNWYPRVRIDHEIIVRHLGPDRTLVRVHIKLSNEGKQLVRLCTGRTRIQHVLPCLPEFADAVQNLPMELSGHDQELGWKEICGRAMYGSGNQAREVEPGETDFVEQDFVIDRSVSCILVYTYIKNEYKSRTGWFGRTPREFGWSRTTVCDTNAEG
jgi:hypothetical protein